MDVRIGIQDAPREVAFESDLEPEELSDIITDAWADSEMITLEDTKGQRIMVPTEKIAFVELGASTKAHVGFGT